MIAQQKTNQGFTAVTETSCQGLTNHTRDFRLYYECDFLTFELVMFDFKTFSNSRSKQEGSREIWPDNEFANFRQKYGPTKKSYSLSNLKERITRLFTIQLTFRFWLSKLFPRGLCCCGSAPINSDVLVEWFTCI